MKYILFNKNESSKIITGDKYTLAVLIKEEHFAKKEIVHNYITPLREKAGEQLDIIALSLAYSDKGTLNKKVSDPELLLLSHLVKTLDIRVLLVADSPYFKLITGMKNIGNIRTMPVNYRENSSVQCVKIPNYASLVYNPKYLEVSTGLSQVISILKKGNISNLVVDPLTRYKSIHTISTLEYELNLLHQHPRLVVDLETRGLQAYQCGIYTIGFSWNEHSAISVEVKDDSTLLNLLKLFFCKYKGELIYHSATFDVKVLIATLFMQHTSDYRGLVEGLKYVANPKRTHCTKILSYLATNNTVENKLSLKYNTAEYLGDYAEDVTDVTKLDLQDLLLYNSKDCIGTYWLFLKNHKVMLDTKQEEVYSLMQESIRTFVTTELVGLPLDMQKVLELEQKLKEELVNVAKEATAIGIVRLFLLYLRKKEMKKKNSSWKVKRKSLNYFNYVLFNLNSSLQLREFFFNFLEIPPQGETKTGQPSTSADSLELVAVWLREFSETPPKVVVQALQFIKLLQRHSETSIILSNFIKSFKKYSMKREDNTHYLLGSYNPVGTKTGRPSSSAPRHNWAS